MKVFPGAVFTTALSVAMSLAGVAQAADAPKPTPTFTKDIAPIFQAKCESCHRPDNMAPMSLVTYEEARPWAKSIASRVGARQMPPWHIDKTIGIQKFTNDRSLNDDADRHDSGVGRRRRAEGRPEGHAAGEGVEGRHRAGTLATKYGQPDLVVKSPDYTMPPVAQDAWWRPTVPTGLTEPRWVRAIDIRPVGKSARKITHHALARLQQPEDMKTELFTNDPNVAGDGLFMEWAVGKNGDEMRPGLGPSDAARTRRSSGRCTITRSAKKITAHTELAVWFYPKGQEPKHREVLGALQHVLAATCPARASLDIPPNQVTTTESFVTLRQNARIENFQAHMHLRGKGMSMEAIYPDGRREMLSQVTDFNFNWHNMYIYDDDVAPLLPKGTILHFLAWYDNTKANKSNPDPDQWVGWGDRTVDEMGHAWINITYYNDDEFKAEQTQARVEGRQHDRRSAVTVRAEPYISRRRPIRTAPFFQGRSVESEWGQTPLWHHSDTGEQQMRGRVLAGIATLAIGWSGGALAGAGQQGIGQSPSPLPLTLDHSREGIERHARVRRLVLRQGRQPEPPRRLLQPQHEAGVRHSGRARTTASSRAGRIMGQPTHFAARPPVGRLHRSSCRRISATRS